MFSIFIQRSKKGPEEQVSSEKKCTNRLPPVIAKWTISKLDTRLEKDGKYYYFFLQTSDTIHDTKHNLMYLL